MDQLHISLQMRGFSLDKHLNARSSLSMEDKHYVDEAGILGGTERLMSAALITRRSF